MPVPYRLRLKPSIILRQKHLLKLAWVPLYSGMTVRDLVVREPPLSVIPAEAGT